METFQRKAIQSVFVHLRLNTKSRCWGGKKKRENKRSRKAGKRNDTTTTLHTCVALADQQQCQDLQTTNKPERLHNCSYTECVKCRKWHLLSDYNEINHFVESVWKVCLQMHDSCLCIYFAILWIYFISIMLETEPETELHIWLVCFLQIADFDSLMRLVCCAWHRCTTRLVPGNPFAPLGLNSNYDIHSATQTN